MKKKTYTRSLIVLLGYILILTIPLFPCHSQVLFRTVSMNNNFASWSLTPIITEAGSDYNNEYNSIVGQMKINVGVPILSSERVSVRLAPTTTWPSNLKLSIRRQGLGSTLLCLNCTVEGGTTFIPLNSSAEVEFFKMTTLLHLLVFTDVELQFKITGASVTLPANDYNANVIFTIGPM